MINIITNNLSKIKENWQKSLKSLMKKALLLLLIWLSSFTSDEVMHLFNLYFVDCITTLHIFQADKRETRIGRNRINFFYIHYHFRKENV